MDLTVTYRPNPLLFSSAPLAKDAHTSILFKLPWKQRPKISHHKPVFRVLASANANGSDGFSWSCLARSVQQGSVRFWSNFGESLKKDTGFDLEDANVKVGEFVGSVRERVEKSGVVLEQFRSDVVPEFVSWNQWQRWKDVKSWDSKRITALFLYIFVAILSSQRIYAAIRAPYLDRQRKELTEAYMEALIPEPSPTNIRKLKKNMWRKTTPKGLKMKKFIERPDGSLVHDSSYVGEDAWVDDQELPQENVKQIVDSDVKLNAEEKEELKKELGISGKAQQGGGTWRERLRTWKEVLQKEKLAEQVDSQNAKYVVEFDMNEVEKSLRKDVVEKVAETQGTRALWIAKRWWLYRPKLPYSYFLEKLDCSEVAAVVFAEDLKRLYVTMKEGFPLEYVVDIPLDPYLFEIISSSGVEVDLLQKRQIHYFMKVVVALVPGLLILWLIRESVMLLHITSKRFLYKKYNQLFDMAYAENFILPVGDVGETKSMYKEVVLGGDVWDLLDELMIYMGNPMQYYERGVQFVRGVLLSGPPGTGKTLFARTLAKESGLPFVFASGAEFTDSEKSGAARINEMFSTARRNAPSFVFVDEIDAIAGRHARKDPRRRATFEALIAQLDGEKEKTGVDRFSLRQAVIFICATNRPDELDLEFVRPGRIDRRLYIGLPDAKQRVQIFGVHSAGKKLAEDVDFGKLVFRTVGFSGADIRNLVNEAAIMSVRKGHSKIYQQDVSDVLDKQLLEGMGVLLTEEEQQKCEESVSFEKKKLLAVHEAGHIVLAHLFPQYDWHAFSQLLPGGKETAISVFYPREDMVDQGYTTFGYMKMQMVVAHGGTCAERVVFGNDITDGGRDDLEKITKIAREMVISPQNPRLGLTALTKRIGLVDRPDNPDGELIRYRWDDPHVIPANMTPEVSELFTRELTRYIEETEELAMNGLMNNRHILDVIALKLLENSRITGLELGFNGMSSMALASPNLLKTSTFNRSLFLQPFSHPFQSSFFIPEPLRPGTTTKSLCFPKRQVVPRSALREWKEYEEAVKRKDLAGALRFLKSAEDQQSPIEPVNNGSFPAESTRSRLGELGPLGRERDWEVLDTCLNADDLKLVGNAYGLLKGRGFLPSFGKFRNIVLEGPRNVTPTVLKDSTGLEVTKFAPKKWGLSESSSPVLIGFLGGASFLIWQGIDLRPNLAVILGLAFIDSIFLGGCCLAQISSYWPPNRRRILIHEAGHLLIAYLMGCPVRGVILDPIVAVQMGIQGQAGTQFWDEKMANDLAEGRLDGTAFDRYSMVLFAGIAAEALIYGEAEGGENDENLFRSTCLLLQPPLSIAEMSNQARWSLLQSYNLLKWHKNAHRAAVKALESRSSLSDVIRRIEEAMANSN